MTMLESILTWIHENERPAASLISVGGTSAIAVVRWLITAKANVRWSRSSNVHFQFAQNNPSILHVEQFNVFNSGRKSAEDLEIAINPGPEHINVFPSIGWSINPNPDGSVVVKFDRLNGGETIAISLLNQAAQPPAFQHLRFDGGTGEKIDTKLEVVRSSVRVWGIRVVFFLGVVAIGYIIFTAVLSWLPRYA